MNCAVETLPNLNGIPYFGSATVVECDPGGVAITIKAPLMGGERLAQARIAVPLLNPLSINDEVLIAGSDLKALFIIGVLSPYGAQSNNKKIIKSKHNAYAVLADNETIQVYSKRQELVFEYDPVNEKTKVNVTKGDLELCTEEGNIVINAAQATQISGHSIDLNSKRFNLKAGYAKLVFDRLDTVVDTLVEQAKNVYRTVAQLTQLRTGRMRTLVDETYQFKANKVFMKSEDDFKIKGEKIHLG